MKSIFTLVLLFIAFQLSSQNESETKSAVIKAEHLITYAAENFPSEDAQQLYILVETGKAGISPEDKFYIEQGIKLLIKRLDDNDMIAIGTYGAISANILPFTEVSKAAVLQESVESLFKGEFVAMTSSGISIAYDMMEAHYDEERVSSVIMIRGVGIDVIEDAQELMASANDVKSEASSTSLYQGTEVSSRDKRKQEREQRKQSRAADHKNLGGAIALTALTLLPEILDVIKD
ncbi:hypothetical protein DCS32_10730 [Dokdonia sp. Dokd-P16]|uniref:hypothetical protein n=1 Tax=Dokdonia sp. Dokd-P16 TaxID=2173169 RepID=UPI000D544D62|nr:hypothetical protein [Dokdonia sp. Dokd-P16]AWH74612.1 hypothetical protein DCS32_10730 [Dokdonia sp. Dokd-P16]